jgi:hypothetical protein
VPYHAFNRASEKEYEYVSRSEATIYDESAQITTEAMNQRSCKSPRRDTAVKVMKLGMEKMEMAQS